MNLLHQFRQHCASQQLVQSGDRLLLAVSGGLDSRVMLDLFCRIKDEWQLHMAVGHVNHQLRGREADEDETFVKTLVEATGLPFFSQRVEVPTYARAQKLSLETAARKLRYQALESFRQRWQARAIVTAHTLDDQAETILDHLLRGSGLAGLAGMPAHRNNLLRPLLPFSRSQLEAYARSRELTWREDRTNTDPQFRRNRIRRELLPLLKDRFNPQILHSLERLAAIADSADSYFRTEAEARLAEVIKEKHPDKIILDIEQFWKYFSIIRRYMVRAVLGMLIAEEGEPTFTETERVLELLQRPAEKGKRFIWRKQVEVLLDHDGAVFRKQKAKSKKQKASDFLVFVTIGERCDIPGTTMALLVERKELPQDWREQVNQYSQFVDEEKIKGQLCVRFPQPGDRFVPLQTRGASEEAAGSKKLSDFFTDLKVPLHLRPTVPILEGDDIIWICGYRLDDRFKITPATRSVLHLQLLPRNNHTNGKVSDCGRKKSNGVFGLFA